MFGLRLGKMGLSSSQTLSKMAQAILRSFGSNASSYPFATLQGAYQTSAGPAALAITDPIGLELDAMGGGGSEFTGGLTTPANWTLFGGATLNAGVAALPVAGAQIFNTIGLESGNWYLVTFTVSASTAGLYLNAYAGGAGAFGLVIGVSDGIKFCYLKAVSAAVVSVQNDPGSTGTCSVSNISCVQVTGNHATQTTAINRPTVQQDGGGRLYASFNGTNQSLALSSAAFQLADDHATTVCLQIGALPVANCGVMAPACGAGYVRCGAIGWNNLGNIGVFYNDNAATYVPLLSPAAYTPGQILVVSEVKRGTNNYLRVNGVQVATGSLATLGAMTLTTGYIGQGATGGDYATGGIYDLDVIKGATTDAQLLTLEKAAAQRAGLVI